MSILVCTSNIQAQDVKTDSSGTIILTDLWGDYENMQHAFDIKKQSYHSHSKGVGLLSDKTIELPAMGPSTDFIRIDPDGKFLHSKFPNAKWSIRNGSFFVVTQFGQIVPSYLHRDDSTHLYKITVEGETYVKKR